MSESVKSVVCTEGDDYLELDEALKKHSSSFVLFFRRGGGSIAL